MASVGMTWCFLLNGISFIALIAGLLMMRLPKFVPPAKPHSTGRHVLEGFRYVASHRRVRILLLLFGVVGIFGWSYSVLLPAYATDILHVARVVNHQHHHRRRSRTSRRFSRFGEFVFGNRT
jgi:hypothetical protein